MANVSKVLSSYPLKGSAKEIEMFFDAEKNCVVLRFFIGAICYRSKPGQTDLIQFAQHLGVELEE